MSLCYRCKEFLQLAAHANIERKKNLIVRQKGRNAEELQQSMCSDPFVVMMSPVGPTREPRRPYVPPPPLPDPCLINVQLTYDMVNNQAVVCRQP